MDHEGSLYLVWLNKGQPSEPEFSVSYVPYASMGREANSRKFLGEESLRDFLAQSLRVDGARIETARFDLHHQGSAEIDSLNVSEEDFRGHNPERDYPPGS
jgi:hypothetical protein